MRGAAERGRSPARLTLPRWPRRPLPLPREGRRGGFDLNILHTYVFGALAGTVLVIAVLLPLSNVLSAAFIFEINYNEGWNVYNADRLIQREQIYDDNYWRVNNYPIGSFLIVDAVNFLFNNLLLSGRLVSLASFAAIGVLAAAAVRRLGGAHTEAVFGAGCALGFCYLMAPAWVGADDPQTLGEAVMLAALVSYVGRPPDTLNLVRTALLVVLGGFIKHNLIAIPAAITCDLALRSPRRLLLWLASCAAFTSGFVGLTFLVAGGDCFGHLLSPRNFDWYGVRYHLLKYLRLFKFPLALLALSTLLFRPVYRVVLAWGAISLVSASILSGFEGTSYNMFQDAAVFLGVAAGIAVSELRRLETPSVWVKIVAAALPLLIAQPILSRGPAAAAEALNVRTRLDAGRKNQEIFLADARYLADRRGPAVCESLLLCYAANKPFLLDPFNSRQYLLSGWLDQNVLIRRIAAREFSVIQLKADICDDPATKSCHIRHYRQKIDRFTDPVLYAIDRYYEIARRSDFGSFYVPK